MNGCMNGWKDDVIDVKIDGFVSWCVDGWVIEAVTAPLRWRKV